jgi:hypothetical protein
MLVHTNHASQNRRASRLATLVAGGGLALLGSACVEAELGPTELAALGIETAPEAWLEEPPGLEPGLAGPSVELAGRRDEDDDVVAVLATVRVPDEAGERRRRLLRFYRLRGRRAQLVHEVRLRDDGRDPRVDLSARFGADPETLFVGVRTDPPTWASAAPPEVVDSGRRPRRAWTPESLEASARR